MEIKPGKAGNIKETYHMVNNVRLQRTITQEEISTSLKQKDVFGIPQGLFTIIVRVTSKVTVFFSQPDNSEELKFCIVL